MPATFLGTAGISEEPQKGHIFCNAPLGLPQSGQRTDGGLAI